MSKNFAIIIQFVLPLTTFYRSGAQKSNVYKRDAFVTSWRFHNRAWQPQRHDRLPETSGTLWIHRGALTNQRCSLATGCGINYRRICASLGLNESTGISWNRVNYYAYRGWTQPHNSNLAVSITSMLGLLYTLHIPIRCAHAFTLLILVLLMLQLLWGCYGSTWEYLRSWD